MVHLRARLCPASGLLARAMISRLSAARRTSACPIQDRVLQALFDAFSRLLGRTADAWTAKKELDALRMMARTGRAHRDATTWMSVRI